MCVCVCVHAECSKNNANGFIFKCLCAYKYACQCILKEYHLGLNPLSCTTNITQFSFEIISIKYFHNKIPVW